jgi:glycosyltransferase involved in cell wall biosynthesis
MDPAPVTVVTPFHNTAAYLRECIESVLRQTWVDFEYLLVDNQSTDGASGIAAEYAGRDPRIRLLRTEQLLPQRDNFNFALRQVPPGTRFVKMALADDWLYPECLERLIGAAERDPEIALVGSYYLRGEQLAGGGLPYDRNIFTGREVCRRQLLEGSFFFGSPTALLYRGSLLEQRRPFFDPGALHEDTEACYQILRHGKFGFVHQVLSFLRTDPTSISGLASRLAPRGLDKLIVIVKYGPDFLDPAEFKACLDRHERRYYRDYVRGILGRHGGEFRRYHAAGRRRIGYRLRPFGLLRAVLTEAAVTVFNPLSTLLRIAARWRA